MNQEISFMVWLISVFFVLGIFFGFMAFEIIQGQP